MLGQVDGVVADLAIDVSQLLGQGPSQGADTVGVGKVGACAHGSRRHR
jgi:hypothetical protein